MKKKYLLPQKSRSSPRRCSVKEGLQGPAQMFSCEYCEIFKNTYFGKHKWTTAPENQHTQWQIYRREVNIEFYYPFKPFSILNFAITFCYVTGFGKIFLFLLLFFCSLKHQVRCYHFFIDEIIVESVNLIRMSK